MRTEFYREIKKFIGIPTGFKGLGYYEEAKGGAAPSGKHKTLKIFRDMPDSNLGSLQARMRREIPENEPRNTRELSREIPEN